MQAPAVPRDEEERLEALRSLGVLDTPLTERFDRVTRLSQRLFGVPIAFVNLVDREQVHMKASQGMELGVHARETSFCGHVILDPKGLVVEDTAEDERFADNPYVVGDPRLRFYAGVPLEAPGGQRVGTFCIADTSPRTFSEADRAVLEDLSLWVQKELNLDEELDRAAEVQRALLPTGPPEDPEWDVAGQCLPSRDVGGDFFDWHRPGGGTVLCLGDVMGKGMPAAILMASVRSALRVGAKRADPADGLEQAAASLAPDLEATGTFVSAFLARLDPDGTVVCADAGHGLAAVVHAPSGTVRMLDASGMPIGVDPSEHYASQTVELGEDEWLVVFSDGLPETIEPDTVESVLLRAADGAGSAEELVQRVLSSIEGRSPQDDVTVIAARPDT